MLNRRQLASLLILASAGVMALAFWWGGTGLSPIEQQLVGKWTTLRPQATPKSSNGTYTGPVVNPRFEWELRKDLRARVWTVAADDPTVKNIDLDRRWRVLDGELRIEDTVGDIILRDTRRRIGACFGIPYTHRIIPRVELPFQLTGHDTLELSPPQGKPITFKRQMLALPTRFEHDHRMHLQLRNRDLDARGNVPQGKFLILGLEPGSGDPRNPTDDLDVVQGDDLLANRPGSPELGAVGMAVFLLQLRGEGDKLLVDRVHAPGAGMVQ